MHPASALSPSFRSLDDDSHLRDTLRHCPAPTLEAAYAYRNTGDIRFIPIVVIGIVARFVEPELRPRLHDSAKDLRLAADLGLDSLSLMEIMLVVEDVLQIFVSAEELQNLRTLEEVRQFISWKASGGSSFGASR